MKRKYSKPVVQVKKIQADFLQFGKNKIDFRDGVNTFSTLDDLLLASNCCGTCCGGGCTCVSDKRLKKDIRPIDNVMDKIDKLQCVSFAWKAQAATLSRGKKKKIGLLAQDVEKVFPDLVVPFNGVKTIDYSGVMALLVEAVKELNDENKRLKKLITTSASFGK